MYLPYYVYAYLRKSNKTPYYIGKGKNNRAYEKHPIKIPKDKSRIVLIETCLTEIGAFALERRLIRWYGRIGLKTGILRNLTDGGEGTYGVAPWNKGVLWNDAVKQKCGVANIGNTYWVGRKHSEAAKAKQSAVRCEYCYVGVNIETGETVKFIGKKAINKSQFTSTHVYRCVAGKAKSHKGYTWSKELLENKA